MINVDKKIKERYKINENNNCLLPKKIISHVITINDEHDVQKIVERIFGNCIIKIIYENGNETIVEKKEEKTTKDLYNRQEEIFNKRKQELENVKRIIPLERNKRRQKKNYK